MDELDKQLWGLANSLRVDANNLVNKPNTPTELEMTVVRNLRKTADDLVKLAESFRKNYTDRG